MISDITFGQYFPSNSIIHRIDPRIKFLILIFIIVFIFLAPDFYGMGLAVAFSVLIMILSRIPFKMYLKNIKAILPILIFTALINSLYVKEGTVLFDKWIITITSGGIYKAVFMAVRITLLIIISSTLSIG